MVNHRRMTGWVLALLLCGAAGVARAALTIEITRGVEGATPVAVVPFGWRGTGPAPLDVAAVVAADLRASGRFAPMAEKDMLSRPTESAQVNFRDWRLLNVENLVIGRVAPAGAGYTVQFQLFDVYRGAQLAGYSLRTGPDGLRLTAHQIADIIYETLTGSPGAFATRIAYVTVVRGGEGKARYSLQVADSDGYNPRTVVNSVQPLMSPSWSPDGTRLAYVSFERRRAEIYVQNVSTGQREPVSAAAGINGAPAWSPDGTRLALVLSKDGNPEIYVLDVAGKRLQRLTSNPAIDTEPAWSPDGRALVFTSDRGGTPQIYRMGAGGGEAQRVTFEGQYNARASYTPDGRRLVLVTGDGKRFRIGVLELANRALQVLTDGGLDESPSVAPNGSMIIYASEERNKGVLSAVSVDGRVRQRIMSQEGDAREPAWSPFMQ